MTDDMRATVEPWLTPDRDGQVTQPGAAAPPVSPADREADPPRDLPVRAPLPQTRPSSTMPLLALHNALARMVDDIDRLGAAGDLEALAAGFSALDVFVRAARDVRNHAEDHIARLMDADKVNLDDRFTLERHRNRTYKYDSLELLRHLVGDQLVDPVTGENVYERLVACIPFTPSLSWRAGALRQYGVDPSEWRETTKTRTTVQVRTRKEGNGG